MTPSPPLSVSRGTASAFTGGSWVLVTSALLLSTVVPALYALAEHQASNVFRFAAWLFSGLIFNALLRRDRALLGVPVSPVDYGFWVLFAWPLLVPVHLFSARHRHGWSALLLYLALYLTLNIGSLALVLVVRGWSGAE